MPTALEIKQQYGLRSNWRGLLALSKDLLLLVAVLGIAHQYGNHPVVAVTAIWVMGAVQFAMGESLLHECSHGNLFKDKRLNIVVGNLLAFAIFTTLSAWQQEHQIHHKYLLSDRDHLTYDYIDYRLYQGFHPFFLWVIQPICGITGGQWLVSELPALFRHRGVFLFYSFWGLVCIATHNLHILLFYWLLPLAWAYSAILYWSEVTDHYLATHQTRSNHSVVWNALFHNGGYHWLHHQYPFIPWYLLKKADADLTPVNADRVRGWWSMYGIMTSHHRQKS